MDDLRYACSTVGARLALWNTRALSVVAPWGIQPLPLMLCLARCMATSFKAGGYRCVEQCFSRARQERLRATGGTP